MSVFPLDSHCWASGYSNSTYSYQPRTITDVFRDVGFKDMTHFGRVFRHQAGYPFVAALRSAQGPRQGASLPGARNGGQQRRDSDGIPGGPVPEEPESAD